MRPTYRSWAWGSFQRRERIAWAAGVFEGEGSISRNSERLCLQVTNTDEWPVRMLQKILGGKVYGPYKGYDRDGFTRKPFWRWFAVGETADAVLTEFEPWLSDRRLERAEEIYAESPP